MNPMHNFTTALRDALLDAHEFESDIFRGVAQVNFATAAPGLAERLQAITLWRAEENAEFFMRLAHLADQMADAVAED